jgi:hypothetical protein
MSSRSIESLDAFALAVIVSTVVGCGTDDGKVAGPSSTWTAGPTSTGAGGAGRTGGSSGGASGAATGGATSGGGAGTTAGSGAAGGAAGSSAGSAGATAGAGGSASGSGGGSAGGAGTGAGGSGSGGPVPPHKDCLVVKVTTATNNGTYAPRNVGVVWITNGSGTFVKTLELWAKEREFELDTWARDTLNAGATGNTVDAITSATALVHIAHTSSWNCADFNGRAVPDGPYQVHFEMTESNDPGVTDVVTFVKGPARATIAPPDTPTFKARQLVFSP